MSLFMFHRGSVHMYLLIYVDDITVASSSSSAVDALLSQLRADFALKDLWPLSCFLGIEVGMTPDGLVLTQDKYTSDILAQACMQKCKPMKTPLTADEELLLDAGNPLSLEDAMSYRRIVGALQYCDRDTSEMRGLSPKIRPGDSRRSGNIETQHINIETLL
jgi:hypothetical protein